MIDWLRQAKAKAPAPAVPAALPTLEVAGRLLPLAIRRTASATRMTMRIAPDGGEVRVTVPRWIRSSEALKFARTNAGWLEAELAKIPAASPLEHGASVPYCGQNLILHHDPKAPRRVSLVDGELRIGGPAETLRARVGRWLEGEARRLLAADLAEYCLRAGKPVPRMLLSRAQRRWGSCAHDGTIRLNWRLVMASPAVRRSVVAHEVTHLIHFDHSPAFHALLAELYEGDIAAPNRWLKAHGRSLYQPFG